MEVVVRCVHRELTGAAQVFPTYLPQRAVQMYATTDRSECWVQAYHVDGDDERTTEVCGQNFRVAKVK